MGELMNRQEKLESAKFALYFGDRMRDELSDQYAAMLAYYVENRDDAEAGRLLREMLRPHINHVLEFMAETEGEDGPACSLGYDSEDEESARLDRRDRARECNR